MFRRSANFIISGAKLKQNQKLFRSKSQDLITFNVAKNCGEHCPMQSTDYTNHTLTDRITKLRHRFQPQSFINDITRSFSTSPLVLGKTWSVTLSRSCCTPQFNQKHCIGTSTTLYCTRRWHRIRAHRQHLNTNEYYPQF